MWPGQVYGVLLRLPGLPGEDDTPQERHTVHDERQEVPGLGVGVVQGVRPAGPADRGPRGGHRGYWARGQHGLPYLRGQAQDAAERAQQVYPVGWAVDVDR